MGDILELAYETSTSLPLSIKAALNCDGRK